MNNDNWFKASFGQSPGHVELSDEAIDTFVDLLGVIANDIRAELLEREAGGSIDHGKPDPADEVDHVLYAKLYPDRTADKRMLETLEAEHDRSERAAAPDLDMER